MKILDARGRVNAKWALEQLSRRALPDRNVRAVVERILGQVRRGGDAAVVKIHNRFAKKKIRKGDLRVRGKFVAIPKEKLKKLEETRGKIKDLTKIGGVS